MIEVTHLAKELATYSTALWARTEILLEAVCEITTVTVTVGSGGIGICTRLALSSVLVTCFESVHGLASITKALT